MFWKFFSQDKKPTPAGGVVFREKNGKKEFLLVSAKKISHLWVLPKGRIRSSETEEKAAVREVKEESGMKVSVIDKVGNFERWRWFFKREVTAFYLMRQDGFYGKNKEKRKVKWLPVDKAIRKVNYSGQKEALKTILPFLVS